MRFSSPINSNTTNSTKSQKQNESTKQNGPEISIVSDESMETESDSEITAQKSNSDSTKSSLLSSKSSLKCSTKLTTAPKTEISRKLLQSFIVAELEAMKEAQIQELQSPENQIQKTQYISNASSSYFYT